MNKEVVQYIESEIFPLYNRNEEGHGINHIKIVIKRSLELAKDYDVNLDIVYTVAAYHDLGHYIDRKTHEIISAEIFIKDEEVKQWFTDEQRNIIKEAIEDHRASSNHEPRTIYGKIISTADRAIINIDDVIKRTYSYRKRNYIDVSEEEQIEGVYQHLIEKFGENGYAKVYLEDKEFEDALYKLRQALSDKAEFIERVKRIIKECTGCLEDIGNFDTKSYIGKTVTAKIDRQLGSKHPKYEFIYPINYGYIPNTISGDGEELDCYVLGVFEPVEDFTGKCIAVIHRINDNDDKLVLVPEDKEYTNDEIRVLTEFQERFFESIIIN